MPLARSRAALAAAVCALLLVASVAQDAAAAEPVPEASAEVQQLQQQLRDSQASTSSLQQQLQQSVADSEQLRQERDAYHAEVGRLAGVQEKLEETSRRLAELEAAQQDLEQRQTQDVTLFAVVERYVTQLGELLAVAADRASEAAEAARPHLDAFLHSARASLSRCLSFACDFYHATLHPHVDPLLQLVRQQLQPHLDAAEPAFNRVREQLSQAAARACERATAIVADVRARAVAVFLRHEATAAHADHIVDVTTYVVAALAAILLITPAFHLALWLLLLPFHLIAICCCRCRRRRASGASADSSAATAGGASADSSAASAGGDEGGAAGTGGGNSPGKNKKKKKGNRKSKGDGEK